jgi:TPR repeat protein
MSSQDFPEKQKSRNEADYRSLMAIMYNNEPENGLVLYNLGKMFTEGNVFLQDYVEGYKWFIFAAEQGNKDAIEAKDLLEKK